MKICGNAKLKEPQKEKFKDILIPSNCAYTKTPYSKLNEVQGCTKEGEGI